MCSENNAQKIRADKITFGLDLYVVEMLKANFFNALQSFSKTTLKDLGKTWI
jgi:hypothetical protein